MTGCMTPFATKVRHSHPTEELEAQQMTYHCQVARGPTELCSFARVLRWANPVTGLLTLEPVACFPLLPASVVVNVPALDRSPLMSVPVLVTRWPEMRQVHLLAFERASLPVAFQA